MITITRQTRPEDLKQKASHVLFVEGHGHDSLDPQIIGELFEGKISIEPLGASFNIKSVAQALHPSHPTYYFLIDRDHHHNDDEVTKCWKNFPDPNTHNLLIWKYYEIENYFLDPDYLGNSDYLKVSKKVLKNKIIQSCQERLYIDAANHVIVSIREELKKQWINKFSNPYDFLTPEQAIKNLQELPEFGIFKNDVFSKIDLKEVEQRFNNTLHIMTNGITPLMYGNGKWLEMIQGKKVLSQVIQSNCFKVVTSAGEIVDGQKKVDYVVKNLLKKEDSIQPEDFLELKRLINNRLRSS